MPVGAFVTALCNHHRGLDCHAPIIDTYALFPIGVLLLKMGLFFIAIIVGNDAIDRGLGSVRFTVGTLDEWHGLGHLVGLSRRLLHHLDISVVLTHRTVRL